jgi:hypothetical protein
MFDPSTPDAFWLDVTNAGLGVFCALCLVAIGWAIVHDLRDKAHARAIEKTQSTFHVLQSPELGLTMADGGKPIEQGSETTREEKSES